MISVQVRMKGRERVYVRTLTGYVRKEYLPLPTYWVRRLPTKIVRTYVLLAALVEIVCTYVGTYLFKLSSKNLTLHSSFVGSFVRLFLRLLTLCFYYKTSLAALV